MFFHGFGSSQFQQDRGPRKQAKRLTLGATKNESIRLRTYGLFRICRPTDVLKILIDKPE